MAINHNHHEDGEEKGDLTSLEKLGEFLHEEDASVDKLLSDSVLPPPPVEEEEKEEEEEETPPPPEVEAVEEEQEKQEDFLAQEEVQEEVAAQEVAIDQEEVVAPEGADVTEEATEEVSASVGPDEIEEESVSDLAMDLEEAEESEEAADSGEAATEDFRDVKDFAENIDYATSATLSPESPVVPLITPGAVQGAPGTPPYSVLVKNILYQDDAQDILGVLRELGFIDEQNREVIEKSVARGQVLISQISEYQAIHLVLKLRRYNIDMQMGLSDEIHPPKYYSNNRGLVSKFSLRQNNAESREFGTDDPDLKTVILTSTPTLDGRQIIKYLGVVSEHSVITEEELIFVQAESAPMSSTLDASEETEASEEEREQEREQKLREYAPNLNDRYSALADKLRPLAQQMKGNAVVGITYQIMPFVVNENNSFRNYYKLTCTGSVVLVR
ncbi:MAG: hypothetical protein HQK53_02280 [Oligoflexia bacterium]|nr:hypothetical protein [Oligoflexia bacterium]